MENNISYTIPLDASNLGIPTLDRCIKLLPFNIETNFYYSLDGKLYFNTKKDFKNKSTAIPAPQVHELKSCMKKSIIQVSKKVEDFSFGEYLDEIGIDIFTGNYTHTICIDLSDNLANDYADFLIKLYDVMIDNEFADIMENNQYIHKMGTKIDKYFDCEQLEINEGDVLTSDFYADFDYHDRFNPKLSKEEIKSQYKSPFFLVKKHEKGHLYAESLAFLKSTAIPKQRFYLHDFRFSTTRKLGAISEFKDLLEE